MLQLPLGLVHSSLVMIVKVSNLYLRPSGTHIIENQNSLVFGKSPMKPYLVKLIIESGISAPLPFLHRNYHVSITSARVSVNNEACRNCCLNGQRPIFYVSYDNTIVDNFMIDKIFYVEKFFPQRTTHLFDSSHFWLQLFEFVLRFGWSSRKL